MKTYLVWEKDSVEPSDTYVVEALDCDDAINKVIALEGNFSSLGFNDLFAMETLVIK